MKFLVLYTVLCASFIINGCHNNGRDESQDAFVPETQELSGEVIIQFTSLINDLGNIKEGEQVLTWFEYTNTGSKPLIIYSIKAGCGCTVPSWNKEPLEPGGKENIKVIFNSRGKSGIQSIRISVNSNAVNSESELRLTAIVESVN